MKLPASGPAFSPGPEALAQKPGEILLKQKRYKHQCMNIKDKNINFLSICAVKKADGSKNSALTV